MKPELLLQQQFDREAKQFQDKANQEWETIKSRVEILGPDQTVQQLMQLEDKNKAAFGKLKEAYARKIGSLGQVDTLAQHGLIPNPEDVKFRMVLGPETEKVMFPKRKDIPSMLRDVDSEIRSLESEIKNYRILPGGDEIPAFWRASRSSLRGKIWPWKEQQTVEEAEVFDPTGVTFDDKGKIKRGTWRKAGINDIKRLGMLRDRLDVIKGQKDALLQRPNVTNGLRHAAASSNRMGIGTLASNISAEIENRKPAEPKPESIRQTRIRVKAPNGTTGTILENEWETYKAQGFTRI